MKSIAILGNMNNAGFIWFRYFRDLGYEVNLYLFENDITGGLKHFRPECDSANYELYKDFIHHTSIRNGLVSSTALSDILYLTYASKFNPIRLYKTLKTRASIVTSISSSDLVITMGIGPAFLSRFNRNVDVFWPYASGVDNVETDLMHDSLKSNNLLKRKLANYSQKSQIRALRKSQLNIITNKGLNAKVMELHNLPFKVDVMPAIYIEDNADLEKCEISKTFTFVYHGRHHWVNDEGLDEDTWFMRTKNSNYIIEAFNIFVTSNPTAKVKMKFVEYGKDVLHSKILIEKYNLQDKIEWSELLNKKDLLKYLKSSTVGIGEFYNVPDNPLGFAGWEILGMGKPLIQGGYKAAIHYNDFLPKGILLANTIHEIADNMNKLFNGDVPIQDIGNNARNYFDKYHTKEHLEKIINGL